MKFYIQILILCLLTISLKSQVNTPILKGEIKWVVTATTPVKEPATIITRTYKIQKTVHPDSKSSIFKKIIRTASKLIRNGPVKPVKQSLIITGKKLTQPEILDAPPLQTRDNALFNVSYTDKKHGFAGTGTSAFAEDDKHHIWIASLEGLIRYDGYRYYLYRNYNSYPGINDTDLAYDIDTKRLWVTSDNGIYFIKNDSVFSLRSDDIDFSKTYGRRIIIDRFKRTWIATKDKGAICIDGTNVYQYNTRSGLPNNYIYSMLIDSRGHIYLGAGFPGLIVIRPDKMILLFSNNKQLPRNPFVSLYENEEGIWAGTYMAGVIRLGKKDTIQLSFNGRFDERVYDIKKAPGGLWFSCYRDGVYYHSPEKKLLINHLNGLANENNYLLFEDSFRNLWVSSLYSGFSRINENTLYVDSFKNNRIGNIQKILPDTKGGKWLITMGNSIIYREKDKATTYTDHPDHQLYQLPNISDGILNNDGTLWLGSYGFGMIRLSADKFTRYMLNDVIENNIISSIKKDSHNTIWFSPTKFGLIALENNSFWKYTKKSGLLSDNITKLFLDLKKNIYWASETGLQRLTAKGIETLYINKNIFSDQVHDFFQADNGVIFLVTHRNGLLIIDHNKIYQWLVNTDLSAGNVKTIIQDSSGRIWISRDKSIESFYWQNSKITAHQVYNESNGSFIPEAGNVLLDETGMPYWIINKMKLVFDKNFILPQKKNPLFSFGAIQLNETSIDSRIKITALPSERITINYSTIYWGRENYLKLSYLIISENNDTTQRFIQNNGSILLNNLIPGNYRIQLKAIDNNDVFYSSALNIQIKNFWYNTWLFRIIMAVLIITAIVFYYRNKSRQQLRINTMLEQKVTEQTATIVKEKNALEASIQTIEKQNREKEVLIEEINHRVKNNLQFIMAMLEMQMDKEYSKEVLQALLGTSRRIKAMSLVHELLYNKKDNPGLSMISYIYELTDNLKEMADMSAQPVTIKLDIDDIIMNSRKALAIGMIISELVSNSFKYAFKNVAEPLIQIQLKKDHNSIMLLVEDNGKGCSDNDQSAPGLGKRLVDIFSRQLEGTYEIKTNGKCTYKLYINDAQS